MRTSLGWPARAGETTTLWPIYPTCAPLSIPLTCTPFDPSARVRGIPSTCAPFRAPRRRATLFESPGLDTNILRILEISRSPGLDTNIFMIFGIPRSPALDTNISALARDSGCGCSNAFRLLGVEGLSGCWVWWFTQNGSPRPRLIDWFSAHVSSIGSPPTFKVFHVVWV